MAQYILFNVKLTVICDVSVISGLLCYPKVGSSVLMKYTVQESIKLSTVSQFTGFEEWHSIYLCFYKPDESIQIHHFTGCNITIHINKQNFPHV